METLLAVVTFFVLYSTWLLLTGYGVFSVVNATNRYDHFSNLPRVAKGSIIFVGDSLICGGEWNEIFPGAISRGIMGQSSTQLIDRLQTHYSDIRGCTIFLSIGTNDVLKSALVCKAHDVVSRVRFIKQYFEGNDNRVFVCQISNLPVALDPLRTSLAVNRELRAPIVWQTSAPGWIGSAHTLDGVHPSAASYRLWAENCRRALLTPETLAED